jgi:hypothetical protein
MPTNPNNLTKSKFIPLISLRTNLKNLKFGSDQPGGGNSNQPFIKTQIPQDFSTSSDITIPLAMPSNLVGPIFRPTSTGGVDYTMRGSMPGATVMLGGENYTVSINAGKNPMAAQMACIELEKQLTFIALTG